MGEEVEFHISLADRNHLHKGFCMEASRIFLFSSFKSIDAFCSKGKASTLSAQKGKVSTTPNVNRQQAPMLCHKRVSAPVFSKVEKIHHKNPQPSSLNGS